MDEIIANGMIADKKVGDSNKKKIVVYSTPMCGYCHMLKNFLSSKSIPFEDVNVANDMDRAREMVERSGQTSVPVIDINGEVIVGFDKQRIEKLL